MKRFALVAALFLIAAPLAAQTTVIITPVSVAAWSHPDHAAVGLNGQPIITNYNLELFAPAQVTAGVPSGAPVVTINLGKPAQQTDGTILSAPLLPQLPQLNVAYVGFLTAVGPGGTSPRSGASGPFGGLRAPGVPLGFRTQ